VRNSCVRAIATNALGAFAETSVMAFPFGSISSGQLSRRNRRRDRAATRKGVSPSRGGAGRLLFDPLEPRVLLSADVLAVNLATAPAAQHDHDLLVQMVTDTVQTGATAQTVERVQVVDRANNGALLAFGDLTQVHQVSIIGGAANNSVTIDTDSFGAQVLPSVAFTGGSGMNALVIDHGANPSAAPAVWQLSSPNAGQVSGPVNVTFTGVQSLGGGAGMDTLSGPSADTTWNVTGHGSGTVAGTSFTGFEHLTSAANNRDTFIFSPGGAMANGIDGGAGGYDTLVLQGNFDSAVMAPTSASAGAVTLDGNTIQYAGLEPITMTGTAANVVFDLPEGSTNAVLSAGATAGTLTLTDPGSAETTTFADPTGSLTINLGAGDVFGNTLTIQSLDSAFGAGLIVNSATPNSIADAITGSFFIPAGSNTVNVDTSVATNGGVFSINATTVNVQGGVTINTQSPTANSGDIRIAAPEGSTQGPHNISIGTGAVLNATASSNAFSAGAITLEASNQNYRVIELPIGYSQKSVGITLTGATVEGGDVTIKAEATDISLASEVPVWAKGFTSTIVNLLSQIPGALLSKVLGIDASVVLRGADANTTITDSTITSAGSVDIESTTDVESIAQAIAVSANAAGFEIAAGYGQATSNVTTTITGTTHITALDSVTIGATGTTSVKTVARASTNVTGNVDPNAVPFAVSIGRSDLTDTAEVDNSAVITATLGNVNVFAKGNDKANTDSSTFAPVDATAGVSVALTFDNANVQSLLNGTITAGGTVSGGKLETFDPTAANVVNLTTGVIHVADIANPAKNGLTNGEQVVYQANNSSLGGNVILPSNAMGGLTNGATYSVIVIDNDDIQLALLPSIKLDPSVTSAHATQTFSVPDADTFSLDAIDPSQNTIRLVNHGFNDGDTVLYSANGNTPITGLTDNHAYTVKLVDATLFKLLDAGGNVVPISQGNALGLQTFTDQTTGAASVGVILAAIDTTNNAIVLPGSNLTDGEDVSYASLEADGIDPIGGLTQDSHYTVKAVAGSPNEFQLVDPNNNNQVVQLADPGAASVQSLSFIKSVLSFTPTSTSSGGAVDGAKGIITLANHGLQTGDAVIYATDPTQSHTVSIATQIPDPSNPGSFIAGPPNTVTVGDQEIGGLTNGNVYYVVVVDANHVRLAETRADALAAAPIIFTDTGSGNDHTLTASPLANGIGATASLTADDRSKSKPEAGGKFNKSKYSDALTKSDMSLALLFGGASAQATSGKANLPGPADQNGNGPGKYSIQNDGLSGAGAVALNYVVHHVNAFVGNNATASNPTTLKTTAGVTVKATSSNTTQELAQSSVSKPGKSKGTAVAVAIGVGIFTNDDEATIFGNTAIDASGTIAVTTTNTYPYLTTPSAFFTGIPQNIVTQGVSAITNLLDGTLGVASNLLNTWVMAGAKTAESSATAYALSIGVNTYFNTSDAIIQSGAQINQNTAYQTAKQSLTVNASTSMELLNVAGNGKWSLNPFGVFFKGTNEAAANTASAFGKQVGTQARSGDIISLGGRSAEKSVGGTVLIGLVFDTTHALIMPGVAVRLGSSGKLNISANEAVSQVQVSQSGGTVGGGGSSTVSFAGSGLFYGQFSSTLAGIEASATQGADITGGAAATITASTGGLEVGVTGTIITGDGSATGIGMSVTVLDLQRTTDAFIGADPTVDPETTPLAASTLAFGNLSVSATTGPATFTDGTSTSGLIIGIAVAGAESSGTLGQSPDNPTEKVQFPANFGTPTGTTGGGIAGAATIAVIGDNTLAYVNAAGTLTTGTLSLSATNNQLAVNISGGVALAFSGGVSNSGGKTIGGAFSLNQTTADTEAFVKGATLTSNAAAVAGSDQVALTALMEGTYSSGSAAVSVNTSDQGKAFAGSISVNRVVDTTKAVMDDITITKAGNIGLYATNSAQIVAVGGGFAGSAGKLGVAGSIGFNQLDASTQAALLGTDRRSSVAMSGNLTVNATNHNIISAIGVSGGVATGADSTAAAFTVGINILSSSQSVFSDSTADGIIAEISNATITGATNVTVTAIDNSVIQSIAGAFGIGLGGSGYGVGLSWNQIVLDIDAVIDNASITASGAVTLTGQSTQDAGLLHDKISAAAVGAAGGSSGNAVGASVAVNGIIDNIEVMIEDGASVTGSAVAVAATDNSTIAALTGAVAISTKSNGVGAAIGANYIDNTVTASIDSSSATATAGAVGVTADEQAQIMALSVGLEGAQNNAAGGSIAISIITDTVVASIAGAATVMASGNVNVKSTNDATIGTLAGQVAIGGKIGVGISVTTAVVVDHNSAFISGIADVVGTGGVSINANSDQHVSVLAVGGAIGGSNVGVAGSATVTVIDDTTLAYVDTAGASRPTTAQVQAGTGTGSTGDVKVDAENTLELLGTAGARLSAARSGSASGSMPASSPAARRPISGPMPRSPPTAR
jgi:hypothetical protein